MDNAFNVRLSINKRLNLWWSPKMLEVPARSLPLEIWVPASFVSEEDHPIVTALRCAYLARAAAIFRVDKILIYLDEITKESIRCQKLLRNHLRYLALPQYLRRRVFPKDISMKYVGVMPPLRAPSHTVSRKISECKTGDLRFGFLFRQGSYLLLEAGLEKPLIVQGGGAKANEVVLVRILDPERMTCEVVNKGNVKLYLNYEISAPRRRLGELLVRQNNSCLKIGTSRLGISVFDIEGALKSKVKTSKRVLIAFGSPKEGLHEILSREGRECKELFDFVVNTAPLQGVVTIRTEEAVAISLATMNNILP